MMKTTVTPGLECPNCGAKLDATSDLEGKQTPKAGDFSVCFKCAAWNIFEGKKPRDLTLRTIRAEEIAAMPAKTAATARRFTDLIKEFQARKAG